MGEVVVELAVRQDECSIPPVRHRKFKRRDDANELSIKLLDRVISLASRPGDLVIDPFGGSGSTYAVCELKGRRWIGMETGPVGQIVSRLSDENLAVEQGYLNAYRQEMNVLFPEDVAIQRTKRGIWTPGNISKGAPRSRVNAVVGIQQQPELMLQEAQAAYRSGADKKKVRARKTVLAAK